jgi:ribosomal protein L32
MLALQLVAALIATVRGWKLIPWAVIGIGLLIGLAVGFIFGASHVTKVPIWLGYILDTTVLGILVIMAVKGRRAREKGTTLLSATRCPNCGELNLPDARQCRWCGQRYKV